MSSGLRIGNREISAASILALLAAVIVLVALLAPESVDDGRANSSYSTAPTGARIAYELAERMGWRTGRRDAPLDAADGRSVQVVLTPQQPLGATEVHRLLENVRRGGGLIFDVTSGGGEIGDSIGLFSSKVRTRPAHTPDTSCNTQPRGTIRRTSTSFDVSTALFEISTTDLKWRRPPPGPATPITTTAGSRAFETVGLGFPLGAGRVVALASTDLFYNLLVRVCEQGADLAVAHTFEYIRPSGIARPAMVFDEYHHGYGAHGGSLTAISRYLAHTTSGHFLEQALLAALILLMAYSPRAILPRDPERMARRSPLEHADALAHAYSDVEATRTATSRLVSGVRRRIGRTVAIAAAADDATFLDAVVRRTPALAPSVDIVRRGLSETLTARQFAAVAGAVLDIERQLSTTPPKAS